MDLAVRTTASPTAIWVIVIVSVVLLAFWLVMVMVYAARPDPRYRQLAELPGPVLGGIHLAPGGRSVAPNREAPAVFEDEDEEAIEGGWPAQDAAQPQVPAQRASRAPAEAPTEPIPAQRAAPASTETAAPGKQT